MAYFFFLSFCNLNNLDPRILFFVRLELKALNKLELGLLVRSKEYYAYLSFQNSDQIILSESSS